MRNYQQGSWLSPATARALLENLANLPEPATPLRKGLPQFRLRVRELARRFPSVFEELQPLLTGQGAVAGLAVKEPDDPFVMAIMGLSRHIRAAWNASQNPREAEWIIFELRQLYQRLSLKALPALQLSDFNIEVPREDQQGHAAFSKAIGRLTDQFIFWGWWPNPTPPPTTFEQIMYRFQRMLPEARQCANSECENPYFFASGRRRFCSGKCARTGQRQYKLKWWNDKGKKRREQKQRFMKKSGDKNYEQR